jgi:hypothetical protein
MCCFLLRHYFGGAGFKWKNSNRPASECFQGFLQRFCICDFIFINDYAAIAARFDAGAGLNAISG